MASGRHAEELDREDEAEEAKEATNAWEQDYRAPWSDLAESAEGELHAHRLVDQRARKRRMDEGAAGPAAEKGVLRYLFVVLDKSAAMELADLKPSRARVAEELVARFVEEYFDQNPLSQLGIIVSCHKRAVRVTEISGTPLAQIATLRTHDDSGGDFSLQNSLAVALESLKQVPPFGSRELLVVMGALSTVDPADVLDTIDQAAKQRVRCSVISLSAEVRVCRVLCEKTNGRYAVALNRRHLQELLTRQVSPMPVAPSMSVARNWIEMGFPECRTELNPSVCSCHTAYSYRGYICPRCKCKACEIPTDCSVCGLNLGSAPQLARSYHHLFPVPPFPEAPPGAAAVRCFGCRAQLQAGRELIVVCPSCRQPFCGECDVFVHEALHNCPGCLS